MGMIAETGLLLVLLLHAAHLLEEPEPIFRTKGESIEMGFCFGADYIVVYKSSPNGDLLLGNSSQPPGPSQFLPASIRDRMTIMTEFPGLLGLEFKSLVPSDSGVYTRECWKNGWPGKQVKHHLFVCLQEQTTQDIMLLPGGKATLWCNHTSAVQGTSVRWYREIYPEYNRTLFVDTSRSMEPLEDLKDQVQVHNNGSLLFVSISFLKYNHNFYCLVLEGEECISYQTVHLPETDEIEFMTVVCSDGEGITLPCSSKVANPDLLFWDTPFGLVEWTSNMALTQTSHGNAADPVKEVYISEKNYALSIPSVSEKYSGQYKCFSPFLVKDYFLIVCPKTDPVDIPFSLGDSAVLSCDPNVKEPFSVQWYRRNNLETDDLVVDIKDPHAIVPEGLKGKFNVSQLDSSLVLLNLSAEDKGEYWCAVLVDTDFLDESDFNELLDNGYMGQCVLSRRSRLVPTGQEDPPSSSTVAYMVLAVVAGVVILAVLCAVLAIQLMRRRRACQSCRYSSKLPGHQASEGGPGDDVACTERLEPTAPSL